MPTIVHGNTDLFKMLYETGSYFTGSGCARREISPEMRTWSLTYNLDDSSTRIDRQSQYFTLLINVEMPIIVQGNTNLF